MSDAVFTNHLARETSPYLRQHQHNPVDWHPWGPDALELARRSDRPIFLSVGYSACHWCHVMEHESFENQEIAKILNDHFVSIKVDREERPDLDQIYMTSVQMLTGQGGWPMSVFLTPDLRPFTGGTYFPPDDRYGRPGFKRVLLTITDWWKNRRAEIDQAAGQLTEAIRGAGQLKPWAGGLDDSLLRNATAALAQAFDPQDGGFGSAPKFPHPMDLRVLLRVSQRFGDDNALQMVGHTLDCMARGGIYDHLGGGFARYSTDARWLVPHFEKMLYDNALLVPGYLEAFQVTGDPEYCSIVEETLAWVSREMTSPEGPFYSTLDADSAGVEGKFYAWTETEIDTVLGKTDAVLFNSVYGVEPQGNWHDPHGHAPEHANILHRTKTFAVAAKLHGMSESDLREQLARCRSKLFQVRVGRVRPGLDDKVLTSWNGLMIGAFALAAQILDTPAYAETAVKAADFILTKMRTPDGRLFRSYSSGTEPKLNAYLEDYAFLADALVTLYGATFDVRWLTEALSLAQVMIDQFWDESTGGFFYTGRAHETLIVRTKDAADNAIPSGNAMAATALLRLAKLTDRADLRDKAERTLRLYQGMMAAHPMAAGQMLLALDYDLGPSQEIAIVGTPGAEETHSVLKAARTPFRPNRVVTFKNSAGDSETEKVVPLLAGKTAQGVVTTYVCENFVCRAPVVGVEATIAALG